MTPQAPELLPSNIRWQRVNDEPFEYAIQQGRFGDEFVKLLDGTCLRRPTPAERAVPQIKLSEPTPDQQAFLDGLKHSTGYDPSVVIGGPRPVPQVREALKEAIAVFESWHDDETEMEFLPRLRAALTARPSDAAVAWQEALIKISDHEWGWTGGGSDVRYRTHAGKTAAKALGISETLPQGWPDRKISETRKALALPPDEPARVTPTVGGEAREKEITRLATIEECARICERAAKRCVHEGTPGDSVATFCAQQIRILAQSPTIASEKETVQAHSGASERVCDHPVTEKRHYPRRAADGNIEIVDRQFDFVRATLPYDYRFTCNAQQWDEAERICQALEGQMISQIISFGVAAPSADPVIANPANLLRSQPEPASERFRTINFNEIECLEPSDCDWPECGCVPLIEKERGE